MTPKVTVCLGSNRPGGVDISLRGLADQTFQDFEIVFTDGRYHNRHAQVLECAKEVGLKQPLYHVPNHRYNGFWGAACGGINTGFMLAAGEIVIILLDYAYCPPGWIETHLKYHDQPRMVMAPHLYCEMPPIVIKSPTPPIAFPHGVLKLQLKISLSRKNCLMKSAFLRSRLKALISSRSVLTMILKLICQLVFQAFSYNYMHTKNDSFPLKTVLDVGGMDENWDRGRGPGDTEFGYRLLMAGLEPWICHEALVYCPNPREIMPNLNTTIPIKWTSDNPNIYSIQRLSSYRIYGRWSYEEGTAYFESRKPMINSGNLKAPNPYDMYEKRKELWEWRNLSQETEAIIPLNNVEDKEYFK